MTEGVYLVSFGDVAAPGKFINGGVVMLDTLKVYGGDSGYYYTGNYSVNGDKISADVRIEKHNPGWVDAFGTGLKSFKIKLEGTRVDELLDQLSFSGHMTLATSPNITLPIILVRRETFN